MSVESAIPTILMFGGLCLVIGLSGPTRGPGGRARDFALTFWRTLLEMRDPPRAAALFCVFAALTCLLSGSVGVEIARAAAPKEDLLVHNAILLAAQGVATVLAALVVLRFGQCMGFRLAWNRRVGTRVVLATGGTLVVVALAFGASLVSAWLYAWLAGEAPEVIGHETLRDLVAQRGKPTVWILVAVVVTVVPLAEELVFRVFLQSAVYGLVRKEFVSIALTSGVFALLHGSAQTHGDSAAVVLLLPIFVLSIGLGWLYERTGTVVVPAIAHGVFNLANIAVAMSLPGA